MPKLNVIMHGLIALFERKDEILGLLPDLGTSHVYRAGFWCGETELANGEFKLDGVQGGNGGFDPEKNLMLGKVTLSDDAVRKARAVIRFPRPLVIHSLRPVAVSGREDFAGADAQRITTTKLATVQVFVYDFEDRQKVKLGTHPWEPPQDDSPFVNLHIYSEEEILGMTAEHPVDAFRQTVSFFRGLDLQLVNSREAPEHDPSEALPEGVQPIELEDLPHRRSRFVVLGQMVREFQRQGTARDTSLLLVPWSDLRPRGGEVKTCSFPVAQDGGGS